MITHNGTVRENSPDSLNSKEKFSSRSLFRDSAGVTTRGSGVGVDMHGVFMQLGTGLLQVSVGDWKSHPLSETHKKDDAYFELCLNA